MTNSALAVSTRSSAVIDRTAMTRAIDVVANVIERRNTVPILSNVRILGDAGRAFITGTDLDIELTVGIDAAIDADFGLTVPAHLLKDLLKKATKSEYVAFTAPLQDGDSNSTIVDFERVKYDLQALPIADFPDLAGPDAATSKRFTLTGAAFWNALDGVMNAISSEETRYYLNGIYMHHVDGQFLMVATDGHRLYLQDLGPVDGTKDMPGVILPRRTVSLLHKLLKGKACPSSVDIELTETRVRIQFDDVTVTSKFIDGSFPDYRRVIPSQNDKRATIDAEAFLEAVRAVQLISSEKGRAVRYDFSAGRCRLVVVNPDQGRAESTIAADYSDGDLDIGFNAGYMIDAVSTAATDGGSISLLLSDAGSPAILTGSREGWKAVLMPMRV
jgi:DNA polymerase-3 subunit beta